ncbi:hypothetical protein CWO90_07875 [Bradyrhizobium sp. Leo121]|nr:hypothetical protein CWO90_07875 [Bradyrhizobium sp. Leo121]
MSFKLTVIPSASEAIHLTTCGGMDCFVAEPVIGPARGGTRWLLAMTGQLLFRTLSSDAVARDSGFSLREPRNDGRAHGVFELS